MIGNSFFPEISETDFERLSGTVVEYSGFSVDFLQREILLRRMALYLKKTGIDLSALLDQLEKYPEKTTEWIDAICPGETQLFRDISFWDVLYRNPVIGFPSSPNTRVLFFDSPTGEEYYSWRILQKTYFNGIHPEVEITTPHKAGQNRIERKRIVFQKVGGLQTQLSGVFESLKLLEHLQEIHNNWYFVDESGNAPKVTVNKSILPFASGSYQLIFCRNRLLYYTSEIAGIIISNLYRALIPGGYLLAGTHDNVSMLTSGGFTLTDKENGIYQRKK